MSDIPPELFKREISKCILLEEQEKNYWIHAADALPQPLLNEMYEFFREKNNLIDACVNKAIEADPSIITELKNKILILKKHILHFEEAEEKAPEEAEKKLAAAIKDLQEK